jgi:hypothetical protein
MSFSGQKSQIQFLVILGEVTRIGFVPPVHGPGIRLHDTHGDFQEGGFPDPVGPHDGQAVSSLNRQVDAVENLVVSESLLHPLELEHVTPAGPPLFESEGRIPPRAHGHLGDLGSLLLDHPNLALSLPGLAGFGAESVHELLMVAYFLFPGLQVLFPPGVLRLLRLEEIGIVAGIGQDRVIVHIEDGRGHVVQKPVIVGYDHHRSGKILQKKLEPTDGEDV